MKESGDGALQMNLPILKKNILYKEKSMYLLKKKWVVTGEEMIKKKKR